MQKKEVDLSPISPLTYSGYHQYPELYETAEYLVSENAGALEAGKYFVQLTLKDRENLCFPSLDGAEISSDGASLRLPYEIKRAQNVFSTPLSVPKCYEGGLPLPQAFAKFGEVVYRYYSDAEGLCVIEPPSECGVYYVRAMVAGSESVHPLSSALVRFEILPLTVSALRMISPPSRLSYFAFETLALDGISLVATLADGSVRAVSASEISVIYPLGGEYLLAKDTHVFLSYGGASLAVAVSVDRIPLDLSSVRWSEEGWVYDGVEREITLAGLPGGVIVSTYKNNHITKAGEHTVTALLSFDRENYDGPSELSYKLTVARRAVPIPSLAPAMYSGALLSPSVPESSLYSLVDPPLVLHAGRYPVTLRLSDGVNDCFEGSETSEITLFFEVQ